MKTCRTSSYVPGVKQGPVLKVSLLVHQEHVSVLRLSMTEERSVQNFYLDLSLGKLPPADGRQLRGAEPAQHSQQHAATRTAG